MAEGIVAELPGPATRSVTTEGSGTRITLIAIALGFLALFLVLPLAAVFVEALRQGTWRLSPILRRSRRAGPQSG